MNDSIIDTNWITFAEKINGQILSKPVTSPGATFTFDNIVQIKTESEKIEFIWADQHESGRDFYNKHVP